MKKLFVTFIIALFFGQLISPGCGEKKAGLPGTPTDEQLAQEIKTALLDKLLHVWYPRILDKEDGGYYTNFSYDWQLLENQDKMIVSQARDLWTASKAAERFPDDPRYREAADHGISFLIEKMWDAENGGFYWEVTKTGEPKGGLSAYKKAYGNAFAIYGLAAYAKLSGSALAAHLAQEGFRWLDKVAHDNVHGGYYDWITADGISAASPDFDRALFPPEAKNAAWKDYNSSIHILEAFAELYTIWPDSLLEERLKEMLHVVRDIMTSDKGYLGLYFESDWTHISYRDSSRQALEANLNYDHVTPGHDIETAYLLLEAAHALHMEDDAETMAVAKRLIDHTLRNGFDRDYAGLFDAGYYFDPNGEMEILHDSKTWWGQAEGLNALLLFARLYPAEPVYKEAFIKQWAYIKDNLIDREHGGWYWSGLDKQPEAKTRNKAHPWKSCYHTGRALMNVLEMLECQCPPFKTE